MRNICLLVLAIIAISAIALINLTTNHPAVTAAGNEIANYRNWSRVNATPALMPPAIASLCAPPQLTPQSINPHAQKYITVYVNDIGQQAMLSEPIGHFPIGSIVVKEKLTKADSRQPELLTVMIKRGAGFNPDNGDWEYLVYSGDGVKEMERGKIMRCQNCHKQRSATDFVFGTYKK